jgi:hypothetical protein
MTDLHTIRTASMSEAKRIAKLAAVHGEPYMDHLLLLVEHAQSDEVRRFAYSVLMQRTDGHTISG